MKEKIAKLVDVKSVMTLTLVGVFSYLAVTNKLNAEQFMTVFTVVIMFYFNKKKEVNDDNKDV